MEVKYPQGMTNLDHKRHGWQDLCKGPLDIAIYYIYKICKYKIQTYVNYLYLT